MKEVRNAFGALAVMLLAFAVLASVFFGVYVAVTRRLHPARSWIAERIGALAIRDVNADGYEDCVVWMGNGSSTLQFIDGRSGARYYTVEVSDGHTAAISGSRLVYLGARSGFDPVAREFSRDAFSEPQLVLADLPERRVLTAEAVGSVFQLATLDDDFIADTSTGKFFVSMSQGKINGTTADGVTTVGRIGEPLDRVPVARIEPALRHLGWNEKDIEQGVRRAVYNGHAWFVTQDRGGASQLVALEPTTLAMSWAVELGGANVAYFGVGRDLAGIVLKGDPGDDDQLVLVDIARQRISFRYRHE